MRIPPSAEDAARRLLALFAQRKARPGEILKHGEVLTSYPKGEVQLEDFKAGLDFAIEQGWVKETEPGGTGDCMLTVDGFSAYH
jgi:hypothetical protein